MRIFVLAKIGIDRIVIWLNTSYWKSEIRSHGGSVGEGFSARPGARISVSDGAMVRFGSNVTIDAGAVVIAGTGAKIVFGDHVYVGRGTVIAANQEIAIGTGTQIAHRVTLIDTDHRYSDRSLPLREQGSESAPIRIGAETWIAAHVLVLKGTAIGDRSVLAGGAVVTRDVSSGAVVAGNPARQI